MLEAGGRVQSIEKAVRILEILAEAGTPMPLREIARRTELPKSTLHGIISTLRETGLVEQSAEDGCYGLGLHLFELGCAASGSRNITAISRPFLQSLANRAGETAFLAALDGTDALLLEVTEAPNPLRVALAPGTRMPLHCTAQGKVFLAWNENAMRQVCRGEPVAYTPHTHTTPEQIQADVAATRERGYAIEDGAPDWPARHCSAYSRCRRASTVYHWRGGHVPPGPFGGIFNCRTSDGRSRQGHCGIAAKTALAA